MTWPLKHPQWLIRRWGIRPEQGTGESARTVDGRGGPAGDDGQFSFETVDDRAQLEFALLAEQLKMVTGKRIDLLINMSNGLIISVILWHLYPAWLIVLWEGVLSLVTLFRAMSRQQFRKGQHDIVSLRRWAQLFTLSTFTTGCLWGLIGSVVFVATDPMIILFTAFMLTGMTVGGIVVNSGYLPTMYAFMLPTTLPVIVAMIVTGGMLYFLMAGLAAMLVMVLVQAGRDINRSIVNNVRPRVGQTLLTARLRISEKAMADVQQIAKVGGLEILPGDEKINCTDETLRIIGADPGTFRPTFQTLIVRVHPEDRALVRTAFNVFLRKGVKDELRCRIIMDTGDVKYVHLVGQVIERSQGRPPRFFVTVQDVTEEKLEDDKLKFAYLLLHTQMEASPDGIAIVDARQKVIASNQLFTRIWDISSEALASSSGDLVFSAVALLQKDPGRFRERAMYLYDHPGQDEEDELETTDGRWIERHTKTLFAPEGHYLGRVWFFRDISDRKRAADELAYRDRLLHAVTEGTSILVKAESPDQEMPQALRILCESMRIDRVLVLQELADPLASPTLRYLWEVQGGSEPLDLASFHPSPSEAAALAAFRAPLRDGRSVSAQLDTAEPTVRRMFEWFGNKSTLMVPIFIAGRIWGCLAADSTSVPRQWTSTEIEMLKTFGDIAGALIAHHEAGMALERSEERFRVLGATAADAIIMMDGAGRISSWNLAAEYILGYTAQEAIGRDVVELLTPARFMAHANEAMKHFRIKGRGDKAGTTRRLTARRKDGVEIAIELSMAGAKVGKEWQAIGILRDVTARKAAEAKLQFANILLTIEMEASPDGILVVDANRNIISSNKRFQEIWKIPQASLVSGKDEDLLAAGKLLVREATKFSALVEKLYVNPPAISDDEFEMLDGRFIERHTVPLTTDSGSYLGRAWFFSDVTESRLAAALALRMARFDVLTGLANRSVFVEAVNVSVARATRGGPGFAVIYLDLDHFKDVNDTLGHPVGDALLQAVALRLRSNTRAVDTVARFGGDEFAIVVADIGEPADAGVVAEKLTAALSVPYVIRGSQIYGGASIGIDVFGPDAGAAEILLSHADVALYRAKQDGRGNYRFFTSAMDQEVRIQVALGTELHEALERNEFFLEYQPQVAVADSHIVGVEALVRWRNPKRGILQPGVFIPIAEKSGLIIELGRWVLRAACAQMKQWINAGIRPIRVAVNLSAVQFKSTEMLENDIIEILLASGLPAQWLELELTETVLMTVTREHSDVMIRLRNLGISVAIDDFGTGFSSLSYLRRFPVDRIKIAQNFVLHLGSEPGDASIVKATIGLSQELGMAVIAEGVETAEQLALLTTWGCQEVQGFYFAHPLTIAEITRLLSNGGVVRPGASYEDVSAKSPVVDG